MHDASSELPLRNKEGKRIVGIHSAPQKKKEGFFLSVFKYSILQDLLWETKSGNMEPYTYKAEDFGSHPVQSAGLSK